MNCTYRRDGRQSYMVLEGFPEQVGYEKRMLQENEVKGLIPFSSVRQNDQVQLWYDITGRKSLRDYLEQEEALSVGFMQRFLKQLRALSEECCRYLLNPAHICMNPDTLYINGRKDAFTVMLCYCPIEMKDMGSGLLAIMEYLLSIVDHNDENTCALCYALYDACTLESCSIRSLCDIARTYCEETDSPAYGKETDSPVIDEEIASSACNDRAGFNNRIQQEKDMPHMSYERVPQSDANDGIAAPQMETEYRQDDRKEESSRLPMADTTIAIRPCSMSLAARLLRGIRHLLSRVTHKTVRKLTERKEQLFPEKIERRQPLIFELDEESEDASTTLLSESAPAAAIRGILKYEGSKDIGDLYVNQPMLSIGSAADNGAVLNVPSVSRHHARLYKQADGFYLEDLNSLNGTRVDTEYLAAHEKRKLTSGSRIFIAAEPFVIM